MIDDILYLIAIAIKNVPKALFVVMIIAACTRVLGWW